MAWTVAGQSRHEVEPIRGSRFVAHVAPCATDDAARAFVGDIAARDADASHHCSAWRLARPSIERANDDGEPSGSAGRPILAQLTGREVIDIVVVVSRWFGGTKLGVGGLVRAYGGAAAHALEHQALVPWFAKAEIVIAHGHPDTPVVDRVLADTGATTVDIAWDAQVTRRVSLAEDAIDDLWAVLADATRGRVRPPDDRSGAESREP